MLRKMTHAFQMVGKGVKAFFEVGYAYRSR